MNGTPSSLSDCTAPEIEAERNGGSTCEFSSRGTREAPCGVSLDTAITYLTLDIPSITRPTGTLSQHGLGFSLHFLFLASHYIFIVFAGQ